MDRRTGRIYEVRGTITTDNLVEMKVQPTPVQLLRGRVGRNDPCPCGSGTKFKRCCYKTQTRKDGK